MKVQVNTSTYEFSHGHKPRGRGSWAFEVAGKTVFSPNAYSYTDARVWAQEQGRSAGVASVKVLP